jgi:hypothetical protein
MPTERFACDLAVLDGGQRARRAELAARLRAGTVRVEEHASGYDVHLRDDPAVLADAEELASLERRCCAFLTLDLSRERAVLRVSGAEGAKAFIAAEMDLLGS